MDMASACLVGERCRYDGEAKTDPSLHSRFLAGEIRPFCPEVLGGLPIPRPRMRIEGGSGEDVLTGKARVATEEGKDCTRQVIIGAAKAAGIADEVKPGRIYMKAGSPSCGCGGGNLLGVAAALLSRKKFVLEEIE